MSGIDNNSSQTDQGRSREFTKGGQTRWSGDGSLQRGPGAEYGNPREHQWGRDKN